MQGDLLDACPTACFALDKNGVVQKRNKHAIALSPALEASEGQDFFRNFQEGRPATELDGTFLLHTPTQECFSVCLGWRNGFVLAVVTHIKELDRLQKTLDNVLQVAVADMSARKKLASQVDACFTSFCRIMCARCWQTRISASWASLIRWFLSSSFLG